MAKRVKRAPNLPNITQDVQRSLTQVNRALYQDGVETNYRLNLAYPKDGTEPFEAPMPLQSVVTGSLPPAANFEGNIIYDTTTNTLKYSNGSAWISLTAAKALSIVFQVFTSSGTYTPTTGMSYCIAQIQAPGGGSGGADSNGSTTTSGGGGGGGEYAEGTFSAATISSSQTVTIGAVGTAGNTSGSNGGTGGTSSLGSLLTAIGGGGGTGSGSASASGASRAGGAGGTGGSGGSFRIPGQLGGASLVSTDNATFTVIGAAYGGSSTWGHITRPSSEGFGVTLPIASVAGVNYGAGAAGPVTRSVNGEAGATGGPSILVIKEFILT